MRARYLSLSLLIFIAFTLIIACAPVQTVALIPAQSTVMPGWQYVATATPVARWDSVPGYQGDSGVYLNARVNSPCYSAGWSGTVCSQPYTGEFVVTSYNGAEVARVMTNGSGQALVNVPPGRYIVGARIAGYYPQAAPVAVNVYAERYASVGVSLTAGPRQAVAR